jgi:hypothetical protein
MNTTTQLPEQPSRPELLNILCILTFIGSGLSAFFNIILFFSIDKISMYHENGDFDIFTSNMEINPIELIIEVDPFYFIIQAMVFAMSVYGAYLMWHLKKYGFHVYAIAQLVLIISTQIYYPGLPFPFFELLISIVFIMMYARNLKFMK